MGGQLLAPHTRAKWTIGSHSSSITFSLQKEREMKLTGQYDIVLGKKQTNNRAGIDYGLCTWKVSYNYMYLYKPGVIFGEWSSKCPHWLPIGPQHTTLNVVQSVHSTTNDVADNVEELYVQERFVSTNTDISSQQWHLASQALSLLQIQC